ncbi:UNVERIFIED_CONTAM: hypothetical protein Sindi_0053500 [Sesamum indicum]
MLKWKKDGTCQLLLASVPVTLQGEGRGNRKRIRQSRIPNDICIFCQGKSHWKRECPKFFPNEGGKTDSPKA